MTMYQAIKFTCWDKLQSLSPPFSCFSNRSSIGRYRSGGRSAAPESLHGPSLSPGGLLFFRPPHCRSLEFTIGLALFEVFALVILGFAFSHRQGDLDFPVLPVKRERQQGIAFNRCQTEELADFRFVQQQLTGRLGLMVLEVAVGVFVNVGVVEINLVIFDARKSIAKLTFASAQGLHLGAVQDNARLEGLEDMVVTTRFGSGQNIGHRKPATRSLR